MPPIEHNEEFNAAFEDKADDKNIINSGEPAELEPAELEPAELEPAELEPAELEPDMWDGADERQKTAFDQLAQENKRLSHELKSDRGRKVALQRKVDELNTKLTTGGDKPTESNNDAPPAKWAEMKQDYPDIAAASEEMMQQASQRIIAATSQKVNEALQPFHQKEAEAYTTAQNAALEERHPNWIETVNSSEFVNWLPMQNAAIQDLVNSNDAADSASLLDYFKNTQPQPAEIDQPTRLADKRKRQLNAGTGIPTRSSGGSAGYIAKDDFAAAFES